MQITCKVTGIQKVARELDLSPAKVRDAAARGLVEHAHRVMELSQTEVPKDTNTLADSGYVGEVLAGRYSVSIGIGYGGPNDQTNPKTGQLASQYAGMVHEMIGVPHHNGKAKFLEDPVNQLAPDLLEAVGKHVRDLLKG